MISYIQSGVDALAEKRVERNTASNRSHREAENEIAKTTDSRWSLHIGRHGRLPVADGRTGRSDGIGTGRQSRRTVARTRHLGRADGSSPAGRIRHG